MNVHDKFFNSIFISYSHSPNDMSFAKRFREDLQAKLGDSIQVWMDKDLPAGKEWRQQIHQRLNSTSLVVVILSPDSIHSPWVTYEWHSSLLAQQSEPFLVHFRKCEDGQLKRFLDHQIPYALAEDDTRASTVWTDKHDAIEEILSHIAQRVDGIADLREYYNVLTCEGEKPEVQQAAADKLGRVSEDLRLAATNYLLAATEFWLQHRRYGPVLERIADALVPQIAECEG